MKRNQKITIIVILILVLTVCCSILGRIHAKMTAGAYGMPFKAGFTTISSIGFADTDDMRHYFNAPDLEAHLTRLELLSFLGGDYADCAKDLKEGFLYLSSQAALPESRRFETPPKLRILQLDTSDKSDKGLLSAAEKLINAYDSNT